MGAIYLVSESLLGFHLEDKVKALRGSFDSILTIKRLYVRKRDTGGSL